MTFHNADELAILDDGDPLDSISREKRGKIGQWCVFLFRNALSV